MAGLSFSRLISCLLTRAIFSAELIQGRPSSPAGNSTIAPVNNDPSIHCTRTNWFDVCWFLFTNYVLHALSVRSLPGENAYASTVFKLCCLLIPYTGLRRGLSLISRATNLTGNDLQAAARANALCMVIRKSDWRPRAGDEIDGCQLKVQGSGATPGGELGGKNNLEKIESVGPSDSNERGKNSNDIRLDIQIKDTYIPPSCDGLVDQLTKLLIETYRFQNKAPSESILERENLKIQGRCELPPGYALSYIPKDMKVYPRTPYSNNAIPRLFSNETRLGTHLASAHDFPRIVFSIIQTVSGAYALYKARGSQIERYGFAAFGLTVLPYIVISIINFLGALVTSEYETIFVVHSSFMDEMINRGGIVDGAVGTIHAPAEDEGQTPLLHGEERVDALGIKIVFDGPADSLRCHDPVNRSSKIEPFSILPFTTPKVSKPWQRHFFLWPGPSSRCPSIRWKSSAARPPETASVNSTISIPSHPPFIRLPPSPIQFYLNITSVILVFIAVATPHVIIGILSGYKARHATGFQSNAMLTWLICGQVHSYVVGGVERVSGRKNSLQGLLLVFLCYGSYCVTGIVAVTQEMIEFGTCKAD